MLLCIYIYKSIPKSLLFKCECLDKKFIAIGTGFDFKIMQIACVSGKIDLYKQMLLLNFIFIMANILRYNAAERIASVNNLQ